MAVTKPLEANLCCGKEMVEVGEAITVVIPLLNEEVALPRLLRVLSILDPPPAEIIAVDGGSPNTTVALVVRADLFALLSTQCGGEQRRSTGVSQRGTPLVCVVQADTILPEDAVVAIRKTLSVPCIALAGFMPLISGGEKWGSGRR